MLSKTRILYRRLRAFVGRGWVVERAPIQISNGEAAHFDAPIFVIGTHRSGTSLLRRIVDSHRRIACPPESLFFEKYTAILEDSASMAALESMGFDREQVLQGLRESCSYFHRAYCLAKGKRRWADKTPQYAAILEPLKAIFGDEARFVIIFRHPLDVSYSIWDRRWKLKEVTGDLLVDTCEYVRESAQKQLEFVTRHPSSALVLHYDQLVRQPEPCLRRLCEFLGEDWDPAMLNHSDQPHDFGTEDPIVRGTKGFNGSFMNWAAWSQSQQDHAWSILGQIAAKLGYNKDSANSAEGPIN